ncbi:Rieske 2Fe-2S domain-containing protein [Rhodothermus marinus]|uniref:Rieske 2Fe-2S domain-containing protein n=1 Tax=Rhodothermus marinus TaxID=29549 RepID=UPI000ACD79CF|nr:Rieske 2Fe-2S domain-containing protein [Rhodothermus marinus]
MKQVKAGETELLLVRLDGQFYALGARCTHYGAPLATGALHGERIICPWHHACFHARTGEHLEPPGMDHLPRFPVRVENDQVLVELPDTVEGRRRRRWSDAIRRRRAPAWWSDRAVQAPMRSRPSGHRAFGDVWCGWPAASFRRSIGRT